MLLFQVDFMDIHGVPRDAIALKYVMSRLFHRCSRISNPFLI